MDDLFAQRISRFNGGFEDTHSEYEIVSSLSIKKQPIAAVVEETIQDNVEVVTVVPHEVNVLGDNVVFCFKILSTLVAASIIALLSWRFMTGAHRAVDTKEEEVERGKGRTAPRQGMPTTHSLHDKKSETTGHCIQNLNEKFERVKDRDAAMSCKEHATANMSNQVKVSSHRIDSVDSTITHLIEDDEEDYDEVDIHVSVETVTDDPLRSSAPKKPCKDYDAFNKYQSTLCRERSSSPPSLVEDTCEHPSASPPVVSRDTPVLSAHRHPNRSTSSELSDTMLKTSRHESPPKDATRGDRLVPQTTPARVNHRKFDASPISSMGPLITSQSRATAMEKTPQRIAQDYCESFQIIEEQLARSGLKIDAARAAGALTMMHQSSRLQEEQAQREFSAELRRQSSVALEKYEKYLERLSQYRGLFFAKIFTAIGYSLCLGLVVEGSRHLGSLMEEFEYFSWRYAGEKFVNMACDCDHNDGGDGETDPTSWVSFVVGPLVKSWYSVASGALSQLTTYTCYPTCLLGYAGVLGIILLLHAIFRKMQFPSLCHHLLNLSFLFLGLVTNLQAWLIVQAYLELYIGWIIVQLSLSAVSAFTALFYHLRARSYFLDRQQKAQQEQQTGTFTGEISICQGAKMLAELDDIAMLLEFVPPLVMLVCFLWKPTMY